MRTQGDCFLLPIDNKRANGQPETIELWIGDKALISITEAETGSGVSKQDIIDLDFICTAVNSHTALLEACKGFIEEIGKDGYYPTAGKPKTDAMRAAIALAEGE